MGSLSSSPAWQALKAHHRRVRGARVRDLFAADTGRFGRFSAACGGLLLDYSKNRVTQETVALLLDLARAAEVEGRCRRMLAGERVNWTEDRAVLHTALRDPDGAPLLLDGADARPAIRSVLDRMGRFAEEVRSGRHVGATGLPIRDVVNIGIGGSDLGPAMAVQALEPWRKAGLGVHFVSNVDPAHLKDTVAGCDPATTLFIVSSKTFTTQETLTNARAARAWITTRLGEGAVARHFVAVSTNAYAVAEFGIRPDAMFEFWDWVGGRFSLWSAIGLSIAVAVGIDRFRELLAGGRALDRHFAEAPLDANLPVLLALVGIWNANFEGCHAHAVLPYAERLKNFPLFLQQLDMESNGKRVGRSGRPVGVFTGPIVFGQPGTNGQHAFYQSLHQGTRPVSADLIAVLEGDTPDDPAHRILVANCLAQGEAFMRGLTAPEARAELARAGLRGEAVKALLPHKVFPGSRPVNTLVLPRLDPYHLGMLVALYEHKIFVQGVIWGVNSFDQWGVELGKRLAGAILAELEGGPEADHDSSTRALITRYRTGRRAPP